MPKYAYQSILPVVLAVALVGCGGATNPEAFGDKTTNPGAGNNSSNSGGDGTDSGTNNSGPPVDDLMLRTESLNLPSAANRASEGILVTAIPTDSGGAIVENATVDFAASSNGVLAEPRNAGQIRYPTSVLFTQIPRERTIVVTATAGGASEQVAIQVTGTELVVQGPTTVPLGNRVTYTATLTNSAGDGIAGRRIRIIEEGAAIETGNAGTATYSFNAAVPGEHTLTFSALGGTETDKITVSVTQASFGFVKPDVGTRVPLREKITIKVEWIDRNGTPVDGEKVEFSSTRGTLDATTVQTTNGVAVTRISSSDPGPAIVTAATDNNLRASIRLRFIATTPAQVSVAAEPASVGPGETSTITATVLDADGNLVTGAQVEFSIDGSGTVYPATDDTDTSGQASTVYTAGSSAATPPVHIVARVDDNDSATTIEDAVTVTINEQPLSVVLGTGDALQSDGVTFYRLPYSVLVTDSLGNPVAGAIVELSINPAPTGWAYKEGQQVRVDTDGDGEADVWVIPPTAVTCHREDVNQNGSINGGEDRDGDGELEPGGVASVPASVTTNRSGVATFSIRYPQSHAGWVRVRLSANTAVEGSQGRASSTFILPLLAKDQQDVDTAPPGLVSPYGKNRNCAVPDS